MQVISSILNMQSRLVKEKEVKKLFEDSQDRIKSMALVHETLYHSSDLSGINLKEYIIVWTNKKIDIV